MIFSVVLEEKAKEIIKELSLYMRDVYNTAIQILLDTNAEPNKITEKELRDLVRKTIPLKEGYSFYERGAIKYALSAYRYWKQNPIKEPMQYKFSFPISVYLNPRYLDQFYTSLGLPSIVDKDNPDKVKKFNFRELDIFYNKINTVIEPLRIGVQNDSVFEFPFGIVGLTINRKKYVVKIMCAGYVERVLARTFRKISKELDTRIVLYMHDILPYIKRIQLFVNYRGDVFANISFIQSFWKEFVDEMMSDIYYIGKPDVHREFNEEIDSRKIYDDTVFLTELMIPLSEFVKGKIYRYYAELYKKARQKGKELPYSDIDFLRMIKHKEVKFYLYLYGEEKYLWLYLKATFKYIYGKYITKSKHKDQFTIGINDKYVSPVSLSDIVLTNIAVKGKYSELFKFIMETKIPIKLLKKNVQYPILLKDINLKTVDSQLLSKMVMFVEINQLRSSISEFVDLESFGLSSGYSIPLFDINGNPISSENNQNTQSRKIFPTTQSILDYVIDNWEEIG